MFPLFVLYIHIVTGLSIRPSILGIPFVSRNKADSVPPSRQYSDTLKNIPVFLVESKYSTPIALKDNGGQLISVFIDPRDALDFLTEIAQAESPGSNIDSGLRIRVKTLYEWLECVDPAIPRVPSKSKYKLIPNSNQLTRAYTYMPLSSNKELFVPLFYSRKLVLPSQSHKSVTPLFLDFEDLIGHINTLNDSEQRELALRSIGIVSLVDFLLENPTLAGYMIVPSTSSLKFCEEERFSPCVKSRELD